MQSNPNTDYEDFQEDLNYDTWMCAKCKKHFMDPEDYPKIKKIPKSDREYVNGIESRLYWLSETEVVCNNCAVESHIPPIDKE